MQSSRRTLWAFVLPFGVFTAFLALDSLIHSLCPSAHSLFLSHPEYWIFPLQTLVCAAILILYWREYSFAPLRPWFSGAAAGLVALGVWISPQVLFGAPPRLDGFNPDLLKESPLFYQLTVILRFARLVIVVPLLEEIFWRGFVMRYLIREDFTSVAFGAFSWLSFFGVAVLFMLEHSRPDWIAAIITGLLFNGVAVRTKSLFACVTAHAIANLGLGLYIMHTRQWGFW